MKVLRFGDLAIRRLKDNEAKALHAHYLQEIKSLRGVMSGPEQIAYALVPTGCICDVSEPGAYCAWCDTYETAREICGWERQSELT